MPRHIKSHDTMVYFVLADFGRGGTSWVERSVNDADRKTTIADIASGQWGDVVKILECNPVENICNDVTEELLKAAGCWDDEPNIYNSLSGNERQLIRWDHERDLRKHEVA